MKFKKKKKEQLFVLSMSPTGVCQSSRIYVPLLTAPPTHLWLCKSTWGVHWSPCCHQWELWRCTNKAQTSLTSSENSLNGKTCLEILLCDNFIHSIKYSKHAQNKLLWVMTCTVKHSVCSSVVERLMITTPNNLLTCGRPESQAVSSSCRTSASQREDHERQHFLLQNQPLVNQTKCQGDDLKPPDDGRPQQNNNFVITEPLTQHTTLR